MEKRAIKFRGIHIETGEWIYGNGCVVIDPNYVAIPVTKDVTNESYAMMMSKIKPETLGQFTDEFYSDTTEVYEGDIYEYDYEYDSDYDGDMPIVKHTAGRGAVKSIFDTHEIKTAKREGGTVKYIGNIYEHPHLLKQ
jgi:uncharacterized phage protein (TIGR01671 family)